MVKDSGAVERMLAVAIEEARPGLAEGGIPIGAALFAATGGCSAAGTTAACRRAIRRSTARPTPSARRAASARYRDKIMVTTLAPCWYCSGLVRQFSIGTWSSASR